MGNKKLRVCNSVIVVIGPKEVGMSSSTALQLPWRATPTAFRLVLLGTGLLWVATLALVLRPAGSAPATPVAEVLVAPGFWILVGLVLLADCYPWLPSMRDVRGDLRFVWSMSISLGAIVAFGAPAVLLPGLSGMLTSLARGSAPWWRTTINALGFGLIGAVALLLVQLAQRWTGPVPAAGPWSVTVVGLLVSAAALLVNGTFLGLASAALGNSTFLASCRQSARALRIWGFSLICVPLIAALALTAPWALLPLVIVVGALNQLSRTMLRSTAAARTDPLTRLANRVTLTRRLSTRIAALDTAGGVPVYLLLVDLDGFKAVNDTHGHLLGDAALRRVADRLRTAVAAGDLVARYGGDEFAVVPGPGSTASIAVETAQRIQRVLAEPLRIGGRALAIGASIGLAATTDPRTDVLELVERADRDLYRVKKQTVPVERRGTAPPVGQTRQTLEPSWTTAFQGAVTAPATGWPGVHLSITPATSSVPTPGSVS